MASNSTLTLTDTTWAQSSQTIDDQADFTPAHGVESASTSVLALVLLPFIWQELVSRLYSIVNGPNPPTDTSVTRFGDVCVNFSSIEVSRSSGEQVVLTAQEFKTLKFFVLNPGRVISRDELLNQAWGYDHYPCSRTVDTHLSKLRQKLERDPSHPRQFHTVHRAGYKFIF
jgi:DNA-binding response OmpR family regulator